VDDFEAAASRFELAATEPFGPDGDRRTAWFDHDAFDGRLGVVELPATT
jgi:hypothetical protein